MLEFPLFIPIKILGQGMGNIMFVKNPVDSKKYFVAMSDSDKRLVEKYL